MQIEREGVVRKDLLAFGEATLIKACCEHTTLLPSSFHMYHCIQTLHEGGLYNTLEGIVNAIHSVIICVQHRCIYISYLEAACAVSLSQAFVLYIPSIIFPDGVVMV